MAVGSTWDINAGYVIDCDCEQKPLPVSLSSQALSGTTILFDDTNIVAELQQLQTINNNSRNVLLDILNELEYQNAELNQTILKTTSSGTIPTDVQSYTIINLGITPSDPDTAYNSFSVNGIDIDSQVVKFSNSSDGTAVIGETTTYDPNGNTLLIIYNTKV